MEFGHMYICVILSVIGIHAFSTIEEYDYDQYDENMNQTTIAYSVGVHMGIINSKKYPLKLFEEHERTIFKDLYIQYVSLYGGQPMGYQEWLIMNNFGIQFDTQESIFLRDTSKRSYTQSSKRKRRFLRLLRAGDILISGKNVGGLVGHAAIMTTNHWVLEMRGGKRWDTGIEDNNKQLSKENWYNYYSTDSITVYRYRSRSAATEAALWADRNYYNPSGGRFKTIRVEYRITTDFESTNPSYCSKLVLQSYYFTAMHAVRDATKYGPVVVPINIPAYFDPSEDLVRVGKF